MYYNFMTIFPDGPLSVIVSFGKSNAFFLSGLYIFTKLLYVVNVLAQFVILNAFLSPKYTFWGYGILNDIVNGREWQESGHFPRVTLCDFNVSYSWLFTVIMCKFLFFVNINLSEFPVYKYNPYIWIKSLLENGHSYEYKDSTCIDETSVDFD